MKHKRISNIEVSLKCLSNSQNVINEFSNEDKTYSIKVDEDDEDYIPKIYGISKNPDTNDYIIVLNNSYCKECGKDGFAKAIWKDGLLKYNEEERKYERKPNKEVTLKCLNNSQNVISDLLNEAKVYFLSLKIYDNTPTIYGISRNPDTNDYIIVLNNSCCKECVQLEIEGFRDIIFEWIHYDQFNIIKEASFSKAYLAIWKDGSLEYNYKEIKYERKPNKEVILKCLNNSQNVISGLLNEVKTYSIKLNYEYDIPKIYGISQNPDTKDYIIVLNNNSYCKECDKDGFTTAIWKNGLLKYNEEERKYERKPNETTLKCLNDSQNIISDLLNEVKAYSTNLNESHCKDGFNTAIWKNGSLEYNCKQIKYERGPNKKVTLKSLNISQNVIGDLLNEVKAYQYSIERYDKYKKEYNRVTSNKVVALKCLHNSQNITNEFLNEVNAYSISSSFNDHFGIGNDGILKIYGISQNPDTNNYIIVLEYANDGNLNNCNNNIIRNYRWNEKLHVLKKIVKGFKKIHGNNKVHRDFHTGNILVSVRDSIYGSTGNSSSDICISDMGLCGEVSNMDKTKIYGVMPFVAPEVLKGKPYTRAADVYSFAMIMYYIATGRQPFANCAHDSVLALNICNGIRPEINELEAPKFYIDLMKNCWNADPEKRPSAIEIEKLFNDFTYSSKEEIKKQVEKADEYRKTNFLSTGNSQSIHPQACYTSRLLNQFTKELPKHDDTYSISAEIIDFTEYFIEQK
ncbi:kinase-like domain-containing protein [Rhizophagus irregularis DAOM 181602=DAOM 197198]|nr:kinase-like domain-containing protein [Rhizophagus irregularis DAOM 181602=DAOM 197198]